MLMCVIVAFVGGFDLHLCCGLYEGISPAPHGVSGPQWIFLFHAVSVPGVQCWGLVLSENLDLDVLLLGSNQRDLVPARSATPGRKRRFNNSFRALWMNLVGGSGLCHRHRRGGLHPGERPAGGRGEGRLRDPHRHAGPGGAHKIRSASLFLLASGGYGGAHALQCPAAQCHHGQGR